MSVCPYEPVRLSGWTRRFMETIKAVILGFGPDERWDLADERWDLGVRMNAEISENSELGYRDLAVNAEISETRKS